MFEIKEGRFCDLIEIENQIPEFSSPKKIEQLKLRLASNDYLLLVTYDNEVPVGYKLGYALSNDVFYSWLGAVLPSHRKMGIAQKMLKEQELLVSQKGYQTIRVKTKNRFRNMMMMLVKNKYQIINFEAFDNVQDHKIHFEKVLIQPPVNT